MFSLNMFIFKPVVDDSMNYSYSAFNHHEDTNFIIYECCQEKAVVAMAAMLFRSVWMLVC